jgi:ribose-phosphate pyrophosphokinase
MSNPTILAGSGNRALAEAIAQEFRTPLVPCLVERFPDGEVSLRLQESVRGENVFLMQPTSPPVNDNLMELLAFADAARRAAAARITAVMPYFGYARSDRRGGRRDPIMASTVASLIEAVGIGHVVTVDIHSEPIEGFFTIPFDNLSAVPLLCREIRGRLPEGTVVVAPDLGAVRRATDFAGRLGLPSAIVHKRRLSGSEVEAVSVIGDVGGRPCLVVDDMIATGATIAECIGALKRKGGGPEFMVAATHGLFIGGARQRLEDAGVTEVIVTDTIPGIETEWPGLRVVTIAGLLVGALQRLIAGESFEGLY